MLMGPHPAVLGGAAAPSREEEEEEEEEEGSVERVEEEEAVGRLLSVQVGVARKIPS